MRNRIRTLLCGVLFAVLAGWPGGPAAQQAAPAIDATTRQQVIDGAIDHMQRGYIFEDVAAKMAAALRTHAKAGAYDTMTSGADFATALTNHLREVSKDKHLRILYNPAGIASAQPATTEEERIRRAAAERRGNYGLHRAERLDGNVGYIELRGFSGSQEAATAVAAAMNLLANTDALIFDLRRNGGGSPVTIGFISSYLFDKPVHLNDFFVRETGRRESFYTSENVEGRRYGQTKPVYVLTSNRTFSAAEEFTYNLKNLKRATIVGETTGGGAHPGGVRRITDHFGIWLPTGRAINPITGTNWEGVGIAPDIAVDPAKALPAAHLDALKKLRSTATDPAHRSELDRAIQAIGGETLQLALALGPIPEGEAGPCVARSEPPPCSWSLFVPPALPTAIGRTADGPRFLA
jgi:retinol-binding protein 3